MIKQMVGYCLSFQFINYTYIQNILVIATTRVECMFLRLPILSNSLGYSVVDNNDRLKLSPDLQKPNAIAGIGDMTYVPDKVCCLASLSEVLTERIEYSATRSFLAQSPDQQLSPSFLKSPPIPFQPPSHRRP